MAMMPLPDSEDGPVTGSVLQKPGHARDRGRTCARVHRNRAITLSARELSGDFQPLAPRLQFAQRADITKEGCHGSFARESAQRLAQSAEPRLISPRAFGECSLYHENEW